MTLTEKQQKFASDIAFLIKYIYLQGYSCTFGEAYRTPQQAAWYEKEGKGIRNSLHCQRLAIDLNFFKDGEYLTETDDYKLMGEFWESLDPKNRWGGRFNDGNHFERQP